MDEPCDLGLFIHSDQVNEIYHANAARDVSNDLSAFTAEKSWWKKKNIWESNLIFSTQQPVSRWGGLSFPAKGQALNTRRSDVGSLKEKNCFSESHLWGERQRTGDSRQLIDTGGTEKKSRSETGWVGLGFVFVQFGASKMSRHGPAAIKKIFSRYCWFFPFTSVPTIDVLLLFCLFVFCCPLHTAAFANTEEFPEKKQNKTQVALSYRCCPETENWKNQTKKMNISRRLCSAILWEVIAEWLGLKLQWNTEGECLRQRSSAINWREMTKRVAFLGTILLINIPTGDLLIMTMSSRESLDNIYFKQWLMRSLLLLMVLFL